MVSLVILIGAEFNAVRYPRYLFGSYSKLEAAPDANRDANGSPNGSPDLGSNRSSDRRPEERL